MRTTEEFVDSSVKIAYRALSDFYKEHFKDTEFLNLFQQTELRIVNENPTTDLNQKDAEKVFIKRLGKMIIFMDEIFISNNIRIPDSVLNSIEEKALRISDLYLERDNLKTKAMHLDLEIQIFESMIY